jgi:putative hydrolase of the HAD superfamily
LRYRAVIFDLWQTLVPWPAESARALYGQMAEALGAPRDQFEEVWLSGRSARETGPIADSVRWVFDQLGLDADPQPIVTMRRDWTRESLIPRPDALSTLEELGRRGHKLGLITVCSTDVVEVWESTPFRGLFESTVFSAEVGISSPTRGSTSSAASNWASRQAIVSSWATARTTSFRARSRLA